MSRVLPILFNTKMVRAIMDGRKTVTRRLVGDRICVLKPEHQIREKNGLFEVYYGNAPINVYVNSPYKEGDILYVRETWQDDRIFTHEDTPGKYFYKANSQENFKWRPSIHMPKEAARIWLKVTDVRVERLQGITEEQAQAEGCNSGLLTGPCTARGQFETLWNSTIKKTDLDRYGWKANPWVWVIEFERCERPEGEQAK